MPSYIPAKLRLVEIVRPGEISQIKIFNPNFETKEKTSHTKWTLYIKIWNICHYNIIIRLKFMKYDLFFHKFGLNTLIWEISPGLFKLSMPELSGHACN